MSKWLLDGQTSLFDCPVAKHNAVSCFTGESVKAEPVTDLMKRLVPDGELFVMVGIHPLVLRKTNLKKDGIPVGHEFYHYMIENAVYSGVFVGTEET